MFSQQNRDELEAGGVTVVPGVVSLQDCDRHQDYFREWLSRFPDGSWPQSARSLIQRYKTGYMAPAWEARLAAKKVFAELWGTDKLLTSIDAIAIGRPLEESKEAFWSTDDNWLHVDQSADRVGLHAYQGAVYLETCDEDDWTFEVIEGSHKYFDEFMHRTQQWRCKRVHKPDLEWFERKGCTRKRVPCPKGSLVLWDSRLFHANARPIQGRQHPGRWRYVIFACMCPASWASPADLHVKRKAYDGMTLTTHWPSQEIYTFKSVIGKKQAQDPGGFDRLPDIATTDEVKRLVGVLPYEYGKDGQEEPPFRPQWDKDTWRDFITEFEMGNLRVDGKSKKKKAAYKA